MIHLQLNVLFVVYLFLFAFFFLVNIRGVLFALEIRDIQGPIGLIFSQGAWWEIFIRFLEKALLYICKPRLTFFRGLQIANTGLFLHLDDCWLSKIAFFLEGLITLVVCDGNISFHILLGNFKLSSSFWDKLFQKPIDRLGRLRDLSFYMEPFFTLIVNFFSFFHFIFELENSQILGRNDHIIDLFIFMVFFAWKSLHSIWRQIIFQNGIRKQFGLLGIFEVYLKLREHSNIKTNKF